MNEKAQDVPFPHGTRDRQTAVLRVADLELDRVERKVERAGKRIELTSKEFALLEYLMRNAGRRITRAMIVEHVWNLSFDTTTNIVDVYINYLRKKVDGDYSPISFIPFAEWDTNSVATLRQRRDSGCRVYGASIGRAARFCRGRLAQVEPAAYRIALFASAFAGPRPDFAGIPR
jgi:hypothetical protein